MVEISSILGTESVAVGDETIATVSSPDDQASQQANVYLQVLPLLRQDQFV
jgi:hypothetical protein